mgnify:CR=1 FL=1
MDNTADRPSQAGATDSPATAWFRFYEELNDFLPLARRKTCFPCPVTRRASIKDAIEALGVPHTEIDLILVNGESVDFSHIVNSGDRISVYPMFESVDIRPLLKLRPEPLRHSKFVLDTHLGRLARYLRMLGLDVLYRNDFGAEELATLSCTEQRILLTRDRRLLHRSIITRGYYIRSNDPVQQVTEVLRRFDLYASLEPMSRCIRCNGTLSDTDKKKILDRLEPKTARHYDHFRSCNACGQIYWKGSHFDKMEQLIARFREPAAETGHSR